MRRVGAFGNAALQALHLGHAALADLAEGAVTEVDLTGALQSVW